MTAMRLVRSNVLAVKDADYVHAARALGAKTRRIIVRHILPNAIAPVLVYATISIGSIIAAEATLTFLGVGLQLPEISWGLQINAGQNRLRDAPHLVFFPSLFLSATVLSFILMGDALRDALDPKLRR
jgi:oligopeptide transport system permease protein